MSPVHEGRCSGELFGGECSLPEGGAASTEDLLPLATVAGPSLEAGGGGPSQNTTPRDSPPSTPGLARRLSGAPPALRLNLDDATWSRATQAQRRQLPQGGAQQPPPKPGGLANKVSRATGGQGGRSAGEPLSARGPSPLGYRWLSKGCTLLIE